MTRDSSTNGRIQWSEHPGRFERHLQRRLGNPLFPLSRQVVSMEEVSKAVEQDEYEQGKFWAWFKSFTQNFRSSISPNWALEETMKFLQDLSFWMGYASAIGGLASSRVETLHKIFEEILADFDRGLPQGKEITQQLRAQTFLSMTPLLAGARLPDNPIPREEEAAAVLCEDLPTLITIGEASRGFGKDFHPSETELLDLIVKGQSLKWFTKEQAKEMTNAVTGNTQ